MSQESSSASNFFGDQSADLEKYIQESELRFEGSVVRRLLKKFGINPKGWDVKEKLGDRLRLPIFDSVYSRFPVRLGTRRLVAKRIRADKRRKGDLAFHELTPRTLFKPEEFARTQIYKEWINLKEDQSVDRRPVGLVFPCVGTPFVAHDWPWLTDAMPGIRLTWLQGGPSWEGQELTVELLDTFLDAVFESGWRAD